VEIYFLGEPFGWIDQANYRSWRLGRRRAGSPVRWSAGILPALWATEDQEGKESS